MRISDWSSDGCSSDLLSLAQLRDIYQQPVTLSLDASASAQIEGSVACVEQILAENRTAYGINTGFGLLASTRIASEDLENLQRSLVLSHARSEEHTSELQSLMRISYAVFCLKKKTKS